MNSILQKIAWLAVFLVSGSLTVAANLWLAASWWPQDFSGSEFLDVGDKVGSISGVLIATAGLIVAILAWRRPTAVKKMKKLKNGSRWRILKVKNCRPNELGVRATIPEGDMRSSRTSDEWALLPSYVVRDHDVDLRERLRAVSISGGFLILVGGSSTGKSRSLSEAVREVLPDWNILFAHDADTIREVAEAIPPRTVVWLDDTPSEKFLADVNGLRAVDVLSLIGRGENAPVVVVDTLWSSRYLEIIELPSLTIPGADTRNSQLVDRNRNAREVLSLAQAVLEIPDQFSHLERSRAQAEAGDSRISRALNDRYFGFTQSLAGAPQQVHRWRYAQPYSKAIINAAIDARRVNVRGPLGIEFLKNAAYGYLSDSQCAAVSIDWFETALADLRISPGDNSSPLVAVSVSASETGGGYDVADYLLEYAQRKRFYEPIPELVWESLAKFIQNPSDVRRLAGDADSRRLYHYAEKFNKISVKFGGHDASRYLVGLYSRQGRVEEAMPHIHAIASSQASDIIRLLAGILIGRLQCSGLEKLGQSGNRYAVPMAAFFRIGQRNLSEAEASVRKSSDGGDLRATYFLLGLLIGQNRLKELEELVATSGISHYFEDGRIERYRGAAWNLGELVSELRENMANGVEYAEEILLGVASAQLDLRNLARLLRQCTSAPGREDATRYGSISSYAALMAGQGLANEVGDYLRSCAIEGIIGADSLLSGYYLGGLDVKGLRVQGDDRSCRLLIGILLGRGDLAGSAALLQRFSNMGVEAYMELLTAHMVGQGRVDEASEFLQACISEDLLGANALHEDFSSGFDVEDLRAQGENRSCRLLIGILLGRGDLAGSAALLQRFSNMGVEAYTELLAAHLAGQGQVHHAISLLHGAAPASGRIFCEIAKEITLEGFRLAGIEILRRASELGHWEAVASLLDKYVSENNEDALLEMVGDGFSSAVERLAEIYVAHGQVDKATELLDRSSSKDSSDAKIRLVGKLAREDRIEEAIVILRQEYAGGGVDQAAPRIVGLLAKAGRFKEAIDFLNTLVAAGHAWAASRRVSLISGLMSSGGAKVLAKCGEEISSRTLANQDFSSVLGESDGIPSQPIFGALEEIPSDMLGVVESRADLSCVDEGEIDSVLADENELYVDPLERVYVKLQHLFDSGDIESAVELVRSRVESDDLVAQARLAQLLVRHGKVDAALDVLRAGLNSGNIEDSAPRLIAILAAYRRYDEALVLMDKLVGLGYEWASLRRAAIELEKSTRGRPVKKSHGRLRDSKPPIERKEVRSRDSDYALYGGPEVDLNESVKQLRELFAAGDSAVGVELSAFLWKCNREDELRSMVVSGHSVAYPFLLKLLQDQDRHIECHMIRKFGLNADGATRGLP
ncbi:hypothetical protein M8C13_05195 [Crossiella sp. SN42]|uniref:tetratricopeptide repeat protein n=1 Tax=Crossiella sp. SN42 TaxID=2944808 RepID=UPI00207C842C|nr:hypothetical protein [Crossiella sp. SN42]MCO1575154.1 hypothetical protein [Crossiella sp. SN42]